MTAAALRLSYSSLPAAARKARSTTKGTKITKALP